MKPSVSPWKCLNCRVQGLPRSRQPPLQILYSTGIARSTSIRAIASQRPSGRKSKQLVSILDGCGVRRTHFSTIPSLEPLPSPTKGLSSNVHADYKHLELDFIDYLLAEVQHVKRSIKSANYRVQIGAADEESLKLANVFAGKLARMAHTWRGQEPIASTNYAALRSTFEENPAKLKQTLKYWLQHYIAQRHVSHNPTIAAKIKELGDLQNPLEWYPLARQMKREIHLHIGPTNSGKTYHALKRLESAGSGIYAGPLRLLAHEVFNRLNAVGKPCDLLTGEMRIFAKREDTGSEGSMISCTVEMTPCNKVIDVAVIDEIQMMADEQRGKAWTTALLGLPAKELHLCGEERTLPLIESISATMGDRLHVHRYERLNPLKVMPQSLGGDLTKLRKGDCLVVFSKRMVHELRKMIEVQTGRKVAVIYGKLPPETRTQQAALFNDPDNGYDVLVASDAIGMGLNLSIRRIIFVDTRKIEGGRFTRLRDAHLKQIAGRAGRFRVAPTAASTEVAEPATSADNVVASLAPVEHSDAPQAPGMVTSFSQLDLPHVQRAIDAVAAPLEHAAIAPMRDVIVAFASLHPSSTPFSYILNRLSEVSQVAAPFKISRENDACRIADIIQRCPDLKIQDRISFCEAPISDQAELVPAVLSMAKCVEQGRPGLLLELEEIKLELLDQEDNFDNDYLRQLELLHEMLVMYLWLSYRFENVFVSRPLASHAMGLVEKRIEMVLAALAHSHKGLEKVIHAREQATSKGIKANILRDRGPTPVDVKTQSDANLRPSFDAAIPSDSHSLQGTVTPVAVAAA